MSLPKKEIILFLPAACFYYGMLLNLIAISQQTIPFKKLTNTLDEVLGEYSTLMDVNTSMEYEKKLANKYFTFIFFLSIFVNVIFHVTGGSKYTAVSEYIKQYSFYWYCCSVFTEIIILQACFTFECRFANTVVQLFLCLLAQVKFFANSIKDSTVFQYSRSNERFSHVVSDESYQMNIYRELRRIYYHQVKIIRISIAFSGSNTFKLMGGLFQLLGLFLVPVLVIAEANIHITQILMIFLLISGVYISSVVGFYSLGQYYEDYISEMYDAVINLDWYTWNYTNKKSYLLLLTRISNVESIVIGFNERLNRNFLIRYVRLSYALLTFLYQTNIVDNLRF
ncbi:uncharacterized protein LOC143204496 [Rhynchophorus ferrugineus]|uniref:uncharacterized protein LOC143204496 n=1 Tax=Rhynchophorus ferrugineus TaxID=354439 RepID=UPI003FCCECC7